MKVLIVKTTSMGDVVHALPVVSDIHANMPEAQIDWLVEGSFADIPRSCPWVREVITCAVRRWRHAPLSAQTRMEFSELRHRLKANRYDLVIDLQGLVKSAVLAKLAGTVVAGYDWESAREPLASLLYTKDFQISRTLSAVARCRLLAAAALGYTLQGEPKFVFRQTERHEPVRKQALIFANASRQTKLWPNDHWVQTVRGLQEAGIESVFAWGSEQERKRVEDIAQSAGLKGAVLPRKTIAELMSEVAKSAVVIGLDTGMTHLSAAMAAPTVAIFCDYPPQLVPLTGQGRKVMLGGPRQCPAAGDVLASALEIAR